MTGGVTISGESQYTTTPDFLELERNPKYDIALVNKQILNGLLLNIKIYSLEVKNIQRRAAELNIIHRE